MQAFKRVFSLITIFLLQFLVFGGNFILAEINYSDYQISLLTYSPGNKLYSVFGHSAIRVYGKETDWVYNYGTFDFDDPSFYFSFIRGNLKYRLSRVHFYHVLESIQRENRTCIETPLQLSIGQKTKIIRYLEMNYLPENREYRYDFLYNNCATRIIDVINFGTSNLSAYNPMVAPHNSFRRLLDPYLESRPWTHIGVDFLMGLPADKKTEGTEASFLPDYLHLTIKNAQVAEISGDSYAMSRPDKVHYQVLPEKHIATLEPDWILWPLVLICFVSLIFDTHLFILFKWLNNMLLLGFGILGLILFVLWMATSHYIFNFNIDLVWANPLLIIVPFIKANKFRSRTKSIYLLVILLIASVGALLSLIIEKNLNLTALAILVMTAIYAKIKSIHKNSEEQF